MPRTMDGTGEPIKVGIIGVGWQTRSVLIPSLHYVNDLKLTALASSRPETASKAEQKYQVKCHVGYENLLADDNVELAIISIPTKLHDEVTLAALEAGKHVAVETGYPKLLDPEIVERMRTLQKKSGTVLMFASCELYMPIYTKFKELLDTLKTKEKDPLWVGARYYFWPLEVGPAGGIHHFLNLLLWLNGPVKSVWAMGRKTNVQCLLEYENGDSGAFLGVHLPHVWIPMERVEAIGHTATLVANNGYELRYCEELTEVVDARELRFDGAKESVWNPTFSLSYDTTNSLYLRGYIPEWEDFVECARTGKDPVANLDQVAASQRFADALLTSIKRGEKVEL